MRARRDGSDLPPDEARELWAHFSDWMHEHPGDLAGFAAELGVKSVRPALGGDGPVLVVSTTDAQVAYGNAKQLDAAPKREKGSASPQANTKNSRGAAQPGPRKPKRA